MSMLPTCGGSLQERNEPLVIAEDACFDLNHFVVPAQYKPFLRHILIPHGLILDRIDRLAADIIECYQGKRVHFLPLLKHTHDSGCVGVPYTFDFIRAQSYVGTESSGSVRVDGIERAALRGQHVVVVEDVIDTGNTMAALLPLLREYGAASVRVAALLEKRTDRSSGFRGHFVGFSIPDAFVVGYNLDYQEAYRDMPHIGVINDAGIEHFRSFGEEKPGAAQ